MSELDVLKERIAYLKVLFGILVVTEISLVGWLTSNFTEAPILCGWPASLLRQFCHVSHYLHVSS